jgi:hypothetical protein
MPTPIDILLDPISLITIAIYAALILWERIAPAEKLAEARAWPLRGVIAFFVLIYVSTYLPLIWGEYLAPIQLLDLSGLHPVVAAIIGLLAFELALYWWHRSMHETNVLWRMFHQMHHSAERVDTFGAFYFSPMDMIGFTLLSSLALTIVGLAPQAATIVILATTFLDLSACERPYAAMARICRAAAGIPFHPSCEGRPRLQLLGPARVGSRVWNVPQSPSSRAGLRFLRRRFGAHRRHALLQGHQSRYRARPRRTDCPRYVSSPGPPLFFNLTRKGCSIIRLMPAQPLKMGGDHDRAA